MKMYWGSGVTAPHNLNLSTRWRWVVSFMPWSLYLQYPLNRKLGGSQSQSWHSSEEKIHHCQLNPSHPALSLVSILTDLPCLTFTLKIIHKNKGKVAPVPKHTNEAKKGDLNLKLHKSKTLEQIRGECLSFLSNLLILQPKSTSEFLPELSSL
jgi:hypothetical protein